MPSTASCARAAASSTAPAAASSLVLGPDGAEYLQGQLTSDVEALEPGTGGYSALLDRKGHMQGDLRVLGLAGEEIWLDTEEVALGAVLKHLQMYSVGRDVADRRRRRRARDPLADRPGGRPGQRRRPRQPLRPPRRFGIRDRMPRGHHRGTGSTSSAPLPTPIGSARPWSRPAPRRYRRRRPRSPGSRPARPGSEPR